MREGWICPACKLGVSPDEKYCDHGGGVPAKLPTYTYPVPYRYPEMPLYDPIIVT